MKTSSCRINNVTLLNAAVSDRMMLAGIELPRFSQGLTNYYMAHLTSNSTGLSVLTLSVDALSLPMTVTLVKIDAEGHELPVLRGMRGLLERDHPVLIVETNPEDKDTLNLLRDLGYVTERLPGSSNLLCKQRESGAA